METSRPQGPVEIVLALGALPPPDGAALGGAARPAQIEEGRAIVASNMAPEAPTAGGEGDVRWGKSPVFWHNLDDAEGGADLFWTIRWRLTFGRVWTHAGMPASKRSTELPSF